MARKKRLELDRCDKCGYFFIPWRKDYEKEKKNHVCKKTHQEITKEAVSELGQDGRQRILSSWRKGEGNVGEVAKKFKVDSMVVAQIICDNIKTISFLDEEAK